MSDKSCNKGNKLVTKTKQQTNQKRSYLNNEVCNTENVTFRRSIEDWNKKTNSWQSVVSYLSISLLSK